MDFGQSSSAPDSGDHPPQSFSSSVTNLRRLLALRVIAIIAWSIALVVGVYRLELALHITPLAATLLVWAMVSLVTWLKLRAQPDVVGDVAFLSQLLFDVLILTILLYFTGGSANPFTMLYLLPLAVAAAVLPARFTWGIAMVTVACYTVLLLIDTPIAHINTAVHDDFGIHVTGMWLGFVFSAGLIAYFVVKMRNTLRESEQRVALAREQVLRDERLVSLGTLAAGAAHELGTPLGTMSILLKEMQHEYRDVTNAALADERDKSDDELVDQLQLLSDQVMRCKETLSVLSASAGQVRAESGGRLSIEQYLDEIVAEWRDMRPSAVVQCHWEGVQPSPDIVSEKTLSQALINILNNAADACSDGVEFDAKWTNQLLVIEVRDQGAGFSAAVTALAGKSTFASKDKAERQGLGLGLFLAHATIGRLGGKVELFNRDEGGGCTRMTLPLDRLLVSEV